MGTQLTICVKCWIFTLDLLSGCLVQEVKHSDFIYIEDKALFAVLGCTGVEKLHFDAKIQEKEWVDQLVVPSCLRKDVLFQMHNSLLS